MKTLNKLSKALLSLFVITAVFVTSLPVVSASAQTNITVKRSKVMESYIGDKNNFTAFVTTDGVIVYCMDIDKKGAVSGTGYTFSKEADAGLLWIIKNSYPNKTITGIAERDQYITQSAVWWYIDDVYGYNKLSTAFKTTDKEAYLGMRNEIIKLVNGGKAHKNDAQTSLSMNLSASSTELKLTSDKKYYVSENINANVTGASTYSVSATGAKNITIINASGAIQTKFNVGESFKIKVPAADIKGQTAITVKTTATGGKESVATYNPNDPSFQRVVSTEINNETVTKSLTLGATPVNPTCKYENGKYYGKNGNVVDKNTYNKECGKVCVVENGKYFGKDGKEVDKNTYNKECGKVCVVENGKYFGKDGKEVDKNTYNKECNAVIVDVPNTGANVSMILIGLGLILIGAGTGLIAYRKKMNS